MAFNFIRQDPAEPSYGEVLLGPHPMGSQSGFHTVGPSQAFIQRVVGPNRIFIRRPLLGSQTTSPSWAFMLRGVGTQSRSGAI